MGQKNNAITLLNAAADIRKLYEVNPDGAAAAIEAHMEEYLQEDHPDDKVAFVRGLVRLFEASSAPGSGAATKKDAPQPVEQNQKLLRLFSKLFGESLTKVDLSSEEHLEKLGQSLNTIFNSINQIIGVIHSTLLGEKPETETIRHIIGTGVGGLGGPESLQAHLDQIQKAFLIAHRAYQEAATQKIRQILEEMSPDKLSEGMEGSLKFGPLKKAELFEIYKEKHALCKKWLDSGRLMDELLRDFEKNCQKLYYNLNTKKY